MSDTATAQPPLSAEDAEWIKAADEKLYSNQKPTFYDESPVILDEVIQKLRTIPEIDERLGPRREVKAYALYRQALSRSYGKDDDNSFLYRLIQDDRIDDVFTILNALKDVPEEHKRDHHQLLGELVVYFSIENITLKTALAKKDLKHLWTLLDLLDGMEVVVDKTFNRGIFQRGGSLRIMKPSRNGDAVIVPRERRFDLNDGNGERISFERQEHKLRNTVEAVLYGGSRNGPLLCALAEKEPVEKAVDEIASVLEPLLSNPDTEAIARKMLTDMRHSGSLYGPRLTASFTDTLGKNSISGLRRFFEKKELMKKAPELQKMIINSLNKTLFDFVPSGDEVDDAFVQIEAALAKHNLSLPDPVKEPAEYAAALEVIKHGNTMVKALDGDHFKIENKRFTGECSELFKPLVFNRRLYTKMQGKRSGDSASWQSAIDDIEVLKVDDTKLANVKDMVDEFATYVVLPYIASKLPEEELNHYRRCR